MTSELSDLRHPPVIGRGAHVRVISPSWPICFAQHRARRADEVMQRLGLRVSYGTHAMEVTDDGVSAGSVEQRAEDFMAAFTDPTVDLVFCALGGATSHELIPLLDAEALRAERKAFVGNSDNVWLNQFLLQEAGLSSYYGVTYVAEMGELSEPLPPTLDYFRRAVMSADDLVCTPVGRRTNWFTEIFNLKLDLAPRQLNMDAGWHWLRTGSARGKFIGAELSVLIAMAAQLDLRLDGCILFWDLSPSGAVISASQKPMTDCEALASTMGQAS